MIKKIIFICTSNKDRSVSLENYFKETHPDFEYRSAGINKYFCEKKRTHLITEDDIKWCDLLVLAEDVHLKVICERFKAHTPIPNGYRHDRGSIVFNDEEIELNRKFIVLNCGEYKQGCIGEDYLTKAEMVLSEIINANK